MTYVYLLESKTELCAIVNFRVGSEGHRVSGRDTVLRHSPVNDCGAGAAISRRLTSPESVTTGVGEDVQVAGTQLATR